MIECIFASFVQLGPFLSVFRSALHGIAIRRDPGLRCLEQIGFALTCPLLFFVYDFVNLLDFRFADMPAIFSRGES
jgi:hypothetical protein